MAIVDLTLALSHHISKQTNAVFEELRIKISHIVSALAIEHVGATSIPGALTKGDVDVLVIVSDGEFLSARNALDAYFSRNDANEEQPDFVSYQGVILGRDYGIQLCAESADDYRFLEFRALLLSTPALLAAYNDIKSRGACLTMAEYRNAKSEFIERHVFCIKQRSA